MRGFAGLEVLPPLGRCFWPTDWISTSHRNTKPAPYPLSQCFPFAASGQVEAKTLCETLTVLPRNARYVLVVGGQVFVTFAMVRVPVRRLRRCCVTFLPLPTLPFHPPPFSSLHFHRVAWRTGFRFTCIMSLTRFEGGAGVLP